MIAQALKLADVCEIVMGQSPPSPTYNMVGDGLPFFQGKTDFGDLYPQVRMFCNKPARIAQAGDILISVRAPVGPTNLADRQCCIGRGLAALRPHTELDTKYLLFFLRYDEPRLSSRGLGSTFGAIDRDDLEELPVPLLDLPAQQRIAAILEKADRLRRLRRHALDLSDTFLPTTFLKMFGDPIKNLKGWEKKSLGEVCNIRRGASPRPIDKFLGGTVPWIKIGDGTKGDNIYITSTEDHVTEEGAARSVFLKKGTLIFANCGVSCGFARLLKIEGCIHDGWLAFEAFEDTFTPIFFLQAINQITLHLRSLAPDGTQPNLNTGIMGDFAMIVPPREMQLQFADIVERYDHLRARQREALRLAEHLFHSLLDRAFTDGLGLLESRMVAS